MRVLCPRTVNSSPGFSVIVKRVISSEVSARQRYFV
jgi:hypothetical protein